MQIMVERKICSDVNGFILCVCVFFHNEVGLFSRKLMKTSLFNGRIEIQEAKKLKILKEFL